MAQPAHEVVTDVPGALLADANPVDAVRTQAVRAIAPGKAAGRDPGCAAAAIGAAERKR